MHPATTAAGIGLCLVVSLNSIASANRITVEQATRAAAGYIEFLQSNGSWDSPPDLLIRLEHTLSWQDEPVGYYFEAEADGWLLIPAFRELPPVTAYSEHGRLSFDHPESFGSLLERILRAKADFLADHPSRDALALSGVDIAVLDRYERLWDIYSSALPQTIVSRLAENELDEYTPGTFLLESTWHQGEPYYNYCPRIGDDICWVGCAATALAQIMNYWEWPPSGEGQHSYHWLDQTLSADFSDPYDWGNILPAYPLPGDYTPEELNAIAELSYEVGVSFEMDYGLDGSGIFIAHINRVLDALREFFHYSDAVNIKYRDEYGTVQEWFDVLQQEIEFERPMWYFIIGHAIVVDGWRTVNLIDQMHFNYGWGGPVNGWYVLDGLPNSDDPMAEFAICGIEPYVVPPQPMEWQQVVFASTYQGAQAVHAADLDGDGDQDLLGAVASADEVIWWRNEDGTGQFWLEQLVDGDFNGARSVDAADLDGDGDMDILGAAYDGNDVAWWENLDGTGAGWSFHLLDGSYLGASSVRAADMDGDGDVDVCAAGYNADMITWWENLSGDAETWAEHLVGFGFNAARCVDAADLDGDGDLDLIGAACFGVSIRWWENLNRHGDFWSEHLVDAAFDGAMSVHAADMDHDGDNDLVGAAGIGDELAWWENLDGSGTSWYKITVDPVIDGANCVDVSDLDGDGNPDILATSSYSNDIAWWANLDGDGAQWANYRLNTVFEGASGVVAADLDGDGDSDVFGSASVASEFRVWLQLGEPGPAPIEITLVPAANPTVVPRGGNFVYDLQLTTGTIQSTPGHLWSMAILPDGQPYGPVTDVQLIFRPGMSILVVNIHQAVPAFAPLGQYQWSVKAGLNLQHPVAMDSFPFTVVEAMGSFSNSIPTTGSPHLQ